LPTADRVVVDWRISEYELVDDNEASHVDKLVEPGHIQQSGKVEGRTG